MSTYRLHFLLTLLLCFTLMACKTNQSSSAAPGDSPSANASNPDAPSASNSTDTDNIPTPSPTVNAIELSAMPTAINFDNIPGPDGVRIRIVLWQIISDVPHAIQLKQGIVECLLYEGQVAPDTLNEKQPAIIWRYSANSLARSMSKSIVGYKYNASLRWNKDNQPKGSTITIAVRLLRPGRSPLYAKPINLALGPK